MLEVCQLTAVFVVFLGTAQLCELYFFFNFYFLFFFVFFNFLVMFTNQLLLVNLYKWCSAYAFKLDSETGLVFLLSDNQTTDLLMALDEKKKNHY